jgi:hypothetical protein
MADNEDQTAEDVAAKAAELKMMKLRKNPEYCRLEQEANTFEWWAPSIEAEWKERRKACRERRQQWGQDDCDERGSERGSCDECSHDIAEFFEIEASKERRRLADEAKNALAIQILEEE